MNEAVETEILKQLELRHNKAVDACISLAEDVKKYGLDIDFLIRLYKNLKIEGAK